MTTAPELDLMPPPATSTAAGPPAIEIHGLRKRFGHTDVLEGIDLTVPRNSVFGFLGPNGAGKSTTMKILVGLLRPTSGSATVAGHDVRHDGVEARASIGYLPQDVTYWRHLSVRDVLGFTARRYLHGSRRALAQRVDETIELAGLGALEKRKVGKLSGGERQRLGVAEAWVGRPEVLILDEPSAGLDPEGRHEVLDLLDRLREEATIFYSTHILDDIERVSDTIAVLSRGHIVAQARPRTSSWATPRCIRLHVATGTEAPSRSPSSVRSHGSTASTTSMTARGTSQCPIGSEPSTS